MSGFPNPLSEFIFTRTYAAWREQDKRRETYPESVARVMSFFRSLVGNRIPASDLDEAEQAMLGFEVMPSMRILAMAGPALGRNHIAGYNCAFCPIDSIDSFAEILFVLMQGTGAGLSVERRYIEQLPVVEPQFDKDAYDTDTFQIPDTTEGWADALKLGLGMWFAGGDVKFDYSLIRPAGTPLKTKGGRASGSEPLRDLLDFTRSILLGAQGRKLNSLECHDIANRIASVVTVGGVRRSSEIVLGDLDDDLHRNAKQGEYWNTAWWRAMSNNSAVYNQKPTREEFDAEWKALVESGTGERGIFSRYGARLTRPARRADAEFGTNPCFAPGTMIQTRQGHFPIESLVGKSIEIWNGAAWQTVDNFRITARNQPMLRITMHDGSYERVTPYHNVILDNGTRIQAKELKPGMRLAFSEAPLSHGCHHEDGAYLKGFLVGDGTRMTESSAALFLYEPKYGCLHRLVASCAEVPVSERTWTHGIEEPGFRPETSGKRRLMQGIGVRKQLVPWSSDYKSRLPQDVFSWDESSKCSFIAGVMDADGTASDTRNGFLYQITSIYKEWLEDFQRLLLTIGVPSRLAIASKARKMDFGDGYGEYDTKETWRLTISQQGAIVLANKVTFDRLTSFADKKMAYNLKPRRNKVASVEYDGEEPVVYCCTVAGSHALGLTSGFLYGQCGEITLRPMEYCNLSEVVARREDTWEDLRRKVRIAALFGTMQSALTDFPYIRPQWRKNCEEERLLGVSITGEMDAPTFRDASAAQLAALRDHAVACNAHYADLLGINRSVAVTCVKPSGTASLLTDASSGIHPRFSPYYRRRVRISATDPLCKLLLDSGAPMSPENDDDPVNPRTWVVTFPVKAPDGAVCRNDLTAIQQLEYWLKVKTGWCEHNPSATVYIGDDEWATAGEWVYEHFDQVGGLSFLPRDSGVYRQSPYEECSQEEYEALAAAFPKIDYEALSWYEQEDRTEGSMEYACTGDKCEIV